MEGYFDIYLQGQVIGNAEVTREGLYYRFVCRCQLSSNSVCRIFANGVSLGIPVPGRNGFELKTKLPVKRFPVGSWDFQVTENRPVLEGKFVPICPEEPFAYLERLKDAYLVRRDHQIGILLK